MVCVHSIRVFPRIFGRYMQNIFKPAMHQLGWLTWLLKIDSVWIVGMHVCLCVCVCVCVCVSTPKAINNQWCDVA